MNPANIPSLPDTFAIDWREDYHMNMPRLQWWHPTIKVDAGVNISKCNRYRHAGAEFEVAARVRSSGMVEAMQVTNWPIGTSRACIPSICSFLQKEMRKDLIEVDVVKRVRCVQMHAKSRYQYSVYSRIFTLDSIKRRLEKQGLEKQWLFYKVPTTNVGSDDRWHPAQQFSDGYAMYKRIVRSVYTVNWVGVQQ